MEALAHTLHAEKPEDPGSTTIKTTLYELIDAISEVMEPGEDRMLPKIVIDMIDTEQIRVPDSTRESVVSNDIH